MTREQDFPIRELGEAIKEARERAGLSHAGLSARVGVSSKTIERWEDGTTLKARDRLDTVAKPLGVSEYDLVRRAYELAGLEPPPIPEVSGEEILAEMIRDMRDAQVEMNLRISHVEELIEAERTSGSQTGKTDGSSSD